MKSKQILFRRIFLWGMVMGVLVFPHFMVSPAWAQDPKPTLAPPEPQPTKAPVEPQPTKAELPPTDVPPTKEPLPTVVPPTKTSLPTIAPTKTAWPTSLPTKTAIPTGVPTKPPLVSPTGAMVERVSANPTAARSLPGAQSPTGAPDTAVTASMATSQITLVTGVVFDDANDNGQRDPDEAGLPGVAVFVETATGTQTVVTDARGVYALSTSADATVRVIVPVGWRTRKPDRFPLTQAGDFPLRATTVAASGRPAALTPLTITQSAIDFAPLIALGLGLGAVMAIGFLRTARAVSTSNRQLALLLVRMQRTSEKPIAFDEDGPGRATDARVLALLNQAGLDASGQPLQIERVLSVTSGEAPAITALGQAGRAAFVVFTPLEAKAFRRLRTVERTLSAGEVAFEHATAYPLDRLDEALATGQAYPVDALSSGLFVADDLAAAYGYLAADLPVSARTLPRVSRWTLLVAPLPRHELTVRASWRHRIASSLRR